MRLTVRRDGRSFDKAFVKGRPARVASTTISQNTSGSAEQERQRIVRHLVQSAPREQEHVGHHIVGRRRIRTTQRIRQYRAGVRSIQTLEAPSATHQDVSVRDPPADYIRRPRLSDEAASPDGGEAPPASRRH
jgi:hypothetical protein